MAADEEIGDYTDIAEGRDIKLTTVGPEVTGTPYNKTSIGPSLKLTPLSDSEDVVNTLLNDQVDPLKVFKPLSYDDMKTALQEWLAPEGEEEDSITSEPAVSFDSDEKKSNYSLDTTATNMKKSKSAQFDDLFSDDKKTDDLPF